MLAGDRNRGPDAKESILSLVGYLENYLTYDTPNDSDYDRCVLPMILRFLLTNVHKPAGTCERCPKAAEIEGTPAALVPCVQSC